MHNITLLISGLILGWSVAIPMGVINLEMIRRTLSLGLRYGLGLGLGASVADLTYLILLTLGLLHFLEQPTLLKIIGIAGSLFITYLAIGILRSKPQTNNLQTTARPKLLKSITDGYMMAALNPFNILFWAAIIGMQAQHAVGHGSRAVLYTGVGLLIGTLTWVIFINYLVYCFRQRFSMRGIRLLNIFGGLLLLGFAAWSLYQAVLPHP